MSNYRDASAREIMQAWLEYAATVGVDPHDAPVITETRAFLEAAGGDWVTRVPLADSDVFRCRVCGCDTDTAPPAPDRAVCEEHCEDHDYHYEPSERGHYCAHCNKRREDESDAD